MKIVVDVSVIGLAQLFETARTGIYRVISSLSKELLGRDELAIYFSSLSSIQVNRLTEGYFEELKLGHRSFPKNVVEKILMSLGNGDNEVARESIVHKIYSRLNRISLINRLGREADIFHSMYAMLPSLNSDKKTQKILTIYDLIPLLYPEFFEEGFVDEFKPIVESFSPTQDFVFTISESTKRDICTYFNMAPERIFVTPLAASPELYYPETDPQVISAVQKRYEIPEGRYFLTLATVEKRKNLATSIQCFRQVLNEPGCNDLNFILAGTKGWKVKQLLEEIDNDPVLRNKVIFTGYIHDEDLSALYSGAEGFLYPSLYEGFGLPPLEAMQCGVPVITSDNSSLPEVVGDAGFLVNPLDTDQICQAMLALLKDSELREMYVNKGLERATYFTWERCADLTVTGYQKVWDGR